MIDGLGVGDEGEGWARLGSRVAPAAMALSGSPTDGVSMTRSEDGGGPPVRKGESEDWEGDEGLDGSEGVL